MKMPNFAVLKNRTNHQKGNMVAEMDLARSDMEPSAKTPFHKLEREPCELKGERRCQDNECIPSIDLCPEEQLVNQNTILIMIVVGLAVVIFLIVLYCFQQKQRRNPSQRGGTHSHSDDDDDDHASLNLPPPTYEEVVTTNLYPPTPEVRRNLNVRTPSWMEAPPLTPPPNYTTALQILARSHESVLEPKRAVPHRPSTSNLVRRSISMDTVSTRDYQNLPVILPEDNDVFYTEKPDHIS